MLSADFIVVGSIGRHTIRVENDQYDTPTTNAGIADLYLGHASGLEADPVWSASGDNVSGGFFGFPEVGDFNNDGLPDLAAGARYYGGGNGKVFVYINQLVSN